MKFSYFISFMLLILRICYNDLIFDWNAILIMV